MRQARREGNATDLVTRWRFSFYLILMNGIGEHHHENPNDPGHRPIEREKQNSYRNIMNFVNL